jgi:hypothetical protein
MYFWIFIIIALIASLAVAIVLAELMKDQNDL